MTDKRTIEAYREHNRLTLRAYADYLLFRILSGESMNQISDPTIGRIVHYTLSDDDAGQINSRRAANAGGPQIGNPVAPRNVFPAMVVRCWSAGQVNLQVFLDGGDVFWATSRGQNYDSNTPTPGQWHWPKKEGA